MCVSRKAATLQDYISDEKIRLIKILVSHTVPVHLYLRPCVRPQVYKGPKEKYKKTY